MDKLRILNLFAIAFLVSLLVQYWFFPKPTPTTILPDVYMSVEKESIVVPNIPKVTLHNTTTGAITIHPCDDIVLSLDSRSLTGVRSSASGFCLPITVPALEVRPISFDALHSVFATQPGRYIVSLHTSM
jgi:hypothetical protein